jgi:hypothetical protein
LALLPGSDDPIRWQLTVLSVVTGLVAPLRPDRAISSNHGPTASSLTRKTRNLCPRIRALRV